MLKPSDKIDLYYTNLPLLEHLIKSNIDSIRRQHHRPFLFNDSICYLAANDHGQYLMDLEEIRHFQSDSLKKTPQNRVEYYGAEGYRAGENIAPEEVENVLHSHPKVEEAAVIGVTDPEWGQVPKAIVVLKNGQTATEQDIMEHCRAKLSSFKRPRSVVFVSELPRNAMGKVLHKKLREQYGQA